jgi:DNA modification methylase
MSVRYVVGDVFEKMKEMPDQSVDLVLTSPP